MLTKEQRKEVVGFAVALSACEFFLGSRLAVGMDASVETKDRDVAMKKLLRYLDTITES